MDEKLKRGKSMAEIIDLEFYRKFRIILPVRSRKNRIKKSTRATTRAAGRRQRMNTEGKKKKEE